MDLFGGAMIVLAFGAILLLWRTLNPPPHLEVTERGILDRRLGLGWIAWDEIEGAYPPGLRDRDTLRIRLNTGPRLGRRIRRRFPNIERDPSQPNSVELELHLADTEVDAVEILQQIMARKSAGQPVESPVP